MALPEELVARYVLEDLGPDELLQLGADAPADPEAAIERLLARHGAIRPSRGAALKVLVDSTIAAAVRGELAPAAAADRIRHLAHTRHHEPRLCGQLAVLVGLAAAWQTDIARRGPIEQKIAKELRRVADLGGLDLP
jgi:hypothetical protein